MREHLFLRGLECQTGSVAEGSVWAEDSRLDRLPGVDTGQTSPKLDAVSIATQATGETLK